MFPNKSLWSSVRPKQPYQAFDPNGAVKPRIAATVVMATSCLWPRAEGYR